MIIDYKNELLHEFSAINSVRNSYQQFLIGLETLEGKSNDQYIAPLNAILSCIAGSHKLDHIRLCCEEDSKHSKIFSEYEKCFDEEKQKDEREAISKYQSASKYDKVDGLKPHQLINMHLNGESLKVKQRNRAVKWINGLRSGFEVSSGSCTLQVGQRLFRGVTLNQEHFGGYVSAKENGTPMSLNGFASTSLSESVATAFATLSHANRLQYLEKEEENPHIPAVLELTNRYSNLPFLMPDALRKPERSQGQMEVLLPEGVSLQPTYIDFSVKPVKIYADILKSEVIDEPENEED
ncbi:ADP-ribosyltransferase [Aliivibrio fischeri]|uniref:ADP-ribosyltransferase n=1 Tax=Aliivibrio fischeri TaxID=668 RepID=UPI0007C5057A|nr:ADP-ribosyltransferase [Aliivibrio fischeri]